MFKIIKNFFTELSKMFKEYFPLFDEDIEWK